MRLTLISLIAIIFSMPVLADPPDHAPAWGKRAKDRGEHPGRKGGKHRGYTGEEWVEDYGVGAGHCNTDRVLTAVGAVAGGVIGNRVASDGNRLVATVIGAVAGGVLGKQIGDAIDDRDRACMGQSLELVPVGRTVVWTNPETRAAYRLRPVRDLPGGCRAFEYGVDDRSGRAVPMTACRGSGGAWTLRRD